MFKVQSQQYKQPKKVLNIFKVNNKTSILLPLLLNLNLFYTFLNVYIIGFEQVALLGLLEFSDVK